VEDDYLSLPPEPQMGNIEYKLKLVNPSATRLQHLVTQVEIWHKGILPHQEHININIGFSYL
jgi:hypothetical protein